MGPELRREVQQEYLEQLQKTGVAVKLREWPYGRVLEEALTLEYAGDGIEAHIFDSGYNTMHELFSTSVSRMHGRSEDTNGHGSHILGIIRTIAPKCSAFIYNVDKVPWKQNLFFSLQKLRTWHYKHPQTPKVANLSLELGKSALLNMVDHIAQTGVHMILAAGNSGVDTKGLFLPSEQRKYVIVGAISKNGYLAWFSNRGEAIDILAPGEGVVSAFIGSPNATLALSGTSSACAIVTGICINYLTASHSLSPIQLKEKLIETSESIDCFICKNTSTPNRLIHYSILRT